MQCIKDTIKNINIVIGCNIGCSVIVSQLFGSKQLSQLKTAVNTTLISSGILCLILTLLGFIFSPALLKLINTPKIIFKDSLLHIN